VRLLLDAHVSGPRVGTRLQAPGHDVRALDQEPALEGLDDESVLSLAAEEQRILVTHNIADFPSILRDWATEQRPHAGTILVYGIDHNEFELIITGIERWLALYPEPANWTDLAAVLDRDFASKSAQSRMGNPPRRSTPT
jgi:predicted nuclease of predicted toxin-antitoxin system